MFLGAHSHFDKLHHCLRNLPAEVQLHQTKFQESPSLDRLLWVPWGLNYFSSWADNNFCPQVCQVSLGFPCVGLSLSMSGISLEKTYFFASAIFVLFLAIIWQCWSLTCSSERFENHLFFSFSPQELFAGCLEAHSTANKQKGSWYFLSVLPDTVSVSGEDCKLDSVVGRWMNQKQF